jgi:transposase
MVKQSDFIGTCSRRGIRVRVGMEATGYSRWFERLLAELGFEVWMGDPAEIEAKRVRKQKTDHEHSRAATPSCDAMLQKSWVYFSRRRRYRSFG